MSAFGCIAGLSDEFQAICEDAVSILRSCLSRDTFGATDGGEPGTSLAIPKVQGLLQSRNDMSEMKNNQEGAVISILIVDDHEVVREGVALVLGRRFKDCVVGHASSYGEAMELIHNARWDLVITDLSINGRGGIDLVNEITGLKRGLPVLVFTMHEESDYGIRAIKNGAAGFVRKDSGVKALMEAAVQVLQGKRYVSNELAQSIVSFIGKDEAGPPHLKLSDREFQVLCRIGHGEPMKEIAAELFLSVKTVSTYRARILDKLGMRSLAEIVKYCIEHSLA
jgi:DNA-binding NarL/FixJ family response regulator